MRRLDWIRFVLNRLYNSALEERKNAWEKDRKSVSLYDQMKGLTRKRKADAKGLGSLSVKVERGMLFRLDRAYQAFFRRCKAGEKPGHPRFRPIARMETFRLCGPEDDDGEEAQARIRDQDQGVPHDSAVSGPTPSKGN